MRVCSGHDLFCYDFKLFIAVVDVRVTAAREYATVNVGARQLVANAASLVLNAPSRNSRCLGLWQHRKRLRRSIGQSSADAEVRFETVCPD